MIDDSHIEKVKNTVKKISDIYSEEFGEDDAAIQYACISFINIMLIINFISVGIEKSKINEYLCNQHEYLKDYFTEKENVNNH